MFFLAGCLGLFPRLYLQGWRLSILWHLCREACFYLVMSSTYQQVRWSLKKRPKSTTLQFERHPFLQTVDGPISWKSTSASIHRIWSLQLNFFDLCMFMVTPLFVWLNQAIGSIGFLLRDETAKLIRQQLQSLMFPNNLRLEDVALGQLSRTLPVPSSQPQPKPGPEETKPQAKDVALPEPPTVEFSQFVGKNDSDLRSYFEGCSNETFKIHIDAAMSHPLFWLHLEELQECELEEDWTFGGNDGDPLEDLISWYEFLARMLEEHGSLEQACLEHGRYGNGTPPAMDGATLDGQIVPVESLGLSLAGIFEPNELASSLHKGDGRRATGMSETAGKAGWEVEEGWWWCLVEAYQSLWSERFVCEWPSAGGILWIDTIKQGRKTSGDWSQDACISFPQDVRHQQCSMHRSERIAQWEWIGQHFVGSTFRWPERKVCLLLPVNRIKVRHQMWKIPTLCQRLRRQSRSLVLAIQKRRRSSRSGERRRPASTFTIERFANKNGKN